MEAHIMDRASEECLDHISNIKLIPRIGENILVQNKKFKINEYCEIKEILWNYKEDGGGRVDIRIDCNLND